MTLKGRIVDHIFFIKSPIYPTKSFLLGIRDVDDTENFVTAH